MESNYGCGRDQRGGSDNDARVAAASNGVGKANFDLVVTFVTGEFGTFASGNYKLDGSRYGRG